VASLSQGRTAAAQCGLFTHKSVPVIFEPPCIIPLPPQIFHGPAGNGNRASHRLSHDTFSYVSYGIINHTDFESDTVGSAYKKILSLTKY